MAELNPTPHSAHKIVVMRAEDVILTTLLSEGGSVVIGRSPAAQISINDPRMSRMHAMIWIENSEAWARDLGSTNGTNVNGRRISAPQLLGEDAILQISDLTIQLRPLPTFHGDFVPLLWIEDEETGLRRSVGASPIHLSDSTVLHHTDGEIWLAGSQGRRALSIGSTFRAAGRQWRLVDADDAGNSTDFSSQNGPPYSIWALDQRRVVLRDLLSGREHTISSSRRARLLRILGARLQQDRTRRRPIGQQGWTADDELGIAVWGDAWLGSASNRLNVLIHRVRRELDDAGFDSECLQKQRGAARLWLQQPNL